MPARSNTSALPAFVHHCRRNVGRVVPEPQPFRQGRCELNGVVHEGDDSLGGLGSEARRRFVEVEPGDVHDGAQTGQEAQDPVRWVNLGVDHPDRLHLVSDALVHVQGKEGNGVVHDGDPGSH